MSNRQTQYACQLNELLLTARHEHRKTFLIRSWGRATIGVGMVAGGALWLGLAAIPVIVLGLVVPPAIAWAMLLRRSTSLAEIVSRLDLSADSHDRIATEVDFLGDADPWRQLAVRKYDDWLNANKATVKYVRPKLWEVKYAIFILLGLLVLAHLVSGRGQNHSEAISDRPEPREPIKAAPPVRSASRSATTATTRAVSASSPRRAEPTTNNVHAASASRPDRNPATAGASAGGSQASSGGSGSSSARSSSGQAPAGPSAGGSGHPVGGAADPDLAKGAPGGTFAGKGHAAITKEDGKLVTGQHVTIRPDRRPGGRDSDALTDGEATVDETDREGHRLADVGRPGAYDPVDLNRVELESLPASRRVIVMRYFQAMRAQALPATAPTGKDTTR